MKLLRLRAGTEVQFRFLNYRDEWETRHGLFIGVSYGSNAYYPAPTWMLDVWDVERGERRGFPIYKIDASTLMELEHDPLLRQPVRHVEQVVAS
jgi:hypothetical protein